jgi:hypothetical protein
MDHEFTVKSALIGGIALFTGHGLLRSSDVAQLVAAIGAILATSMAYVQRIGAMLLGISLGFPSDRFPLPRLFDIVTQASEYGSLYVVQRQPRRNVCSATILEERHLLATDLRRS